MCGDDDGWGKLAARPFTVKHEKSEAGNRGEPTLAFSASLTSRLYRFIYTTTPFGFFCSRAILMWSELRHVLVITVRRVEEVKKVTPAVRHSIESSRRHRANWSSRLLFTPARASRCLSYFGGAKFHPWVYFYSSPPDSNLMTVNVCLASSHRQQLISTDIFSGQQDFSFVISSSLRA